MQGFTYKYGDRPLEGYTIQRAAGRGGFGEVYYALSDSGREVALKVVQGFQEIELRGISQCMNLKSPHLVTIFDVRENEQGKPFVLMEYVAGPSLRELIDESPAGLGTQKAAFFLREIAKGLTYLHDRGIVHRDLKPGNVFYEDGYVKIGDYGLSKAISASKHSGQTITVGTVHYMAPEIGQGRYDRSIDIYAMGCMLYEMLTGQTPFLGGSTGEILMKHLVEEPKLDGIEEPFASAIRKAMAKDPKDRFQTVQEMVEAVFGAEHIQQSVSCFSPDNLTMVAGRVARKVSAGGPGSSGQVGIGPRSGGTGQGGDFADRLGEQMERLGQRLGAAGERIGRQFERVGERIDERVRGLRAADKPAPPPAPLDALAVDPRRDPLSHRAHVILYMATVALISAGTGMFSAGFWGGRFPYAWFASFMVISGAASGLMAVRRWLEPGLRRESPLVRRFAYGGMACMVGALFCFFPLMAAGGHAQRIMREQDIPGTALAIALVLFLVNWSKMMDPARRERIALGPALWVTFLGGLFSLFASIFFGVNAPFAMGTLAGIALAIQARSPFDPRAMRGPRKPRSYEVTVEVGRDDGKSSPEIQAEPQRREYAPLRPQRVQPRDHEPLSAFDNFMMAFEYPRVRPRPLSSPVRAVLLAMAAVLLVVGFSALSDVLAGSVPRDGRLRLGFLALSSLLVAVVPLMVGLWGKMTGVWPTFVRPIVSEVLVAVALTGVLGLDWSGGRLGPGALVISLFALVTVVILNLLPARLSRSAAVEAHQGEAPDWQMPPAMPGDVVDPAAAGSAGDPSDGAVTARPVSRYADSQISQIPKRPLDLVRPLLAALVGMLILLSLVAGLAGTLSRPALTVMAAFDKNPPTWFDSVMDGSWQGILDSLEKAVSAGLMFLAAIVLIVARRWAGGAHMFRAVAGAIGLLMSLQMARLAMNLDAVDWNAKASLVQHGYYQEVLRDVLERVYPGGMVLAGLVMLGSFLVLAWPPRRQEPMPPVGKGV